MGTNNKKSQETCILTIEGRTGGAWWVKKNSMTGSKQEASMMASLISVQR